MELEYRIWMRIPSHGGAVGSEAIVLATTIQRLTDGPEIGKITTPVREGFADNFARERGGPGLDAWARLAKQTEDEREILGFPRSHPILVRTGQYRASWTQRSHLNHFERKHRASGNRLLILVGSLDPRVPTLEGGFESMPAHLVEGVDPFDDLSVRMHGLGGGVPARPVRFISKHFQSATGRAVKFLLDSKVKSVKASK